MQINLTGHHVEITPPSLREYVTTKFDKLERFFDKINSVHVILNVEKLQQVQKRPCILTRGGKSTQKRILKICMPLLTH